MSRASSKLLTGASGAAGGGPVYVDDVFSTFLYKGTGSTQSINNGIDLAGKGGFVWIKSRTSTADHILFTTDQGVNRVLYTNYDIGESNLSNSITAFNNNGFTLGSSNNVNSSSPDYVSWTFREQEKFFDVVEYSGTGSAQNISHNLGSVPGFIWIKRTSGTEDWICYHRSLGNTKGTPLGQTNAAFTVSGYWNDTTPTESVFTVGSHDRVNTSGHDYIAYIFAHNEADFGTDSDEPIIYCGSYAGNGSTTSNDINVGFEPQYILIKNITFSDNWFVFDIMRGILSEPGGDSYLIPNRSDSEVSSQNYIDILPNGFSLRDDNQAINSASCNYIYMAIRRPHKPASEFAATDLFTAANGLNASAGGKAYATTYPVDMHLAKNNNSSSGDWYLRDRLRGGGTYLNPNDPRAESTHQYNNEFDHMDGVYTTTALNNTGGVGYDFRRAPGFFDVVTYTGVSQSTVVKHNLGVVPEMVWRKRRDASQQYYVWVSALSGSGNSQGQGNFYTNSMGFSNGQYYAGDTQFAASTPPTATQFTQGAQGTSGARYVAYLFASVAGISKIGTYTGTGYDIDVNCGFSSGARFVMVKSASNGHFYIWDTVRGLVAGSDPYLWLGSNSGQTTGDDYIDPLSTGFTITSSGPTELNSSGVTYAFLAIA